MAQPVYKVWFMKYKDAWYKLTPEERSKYETQISESLKQVGGERVATCVCAWASEEWLGWGVEKYPSIEAVQQHAMNLFNMNWFEQIESKTYLGMEMPPM
jgi:hypothetical protein